MPENQPTPEQYAYTAEYNLVGIRSISSAPFTINGQGNSVGVPSYVGSSSPSSVPTPLTPTGDIQSSASVGFNVGTGWWMGFDTDGIPKFFIGTAGSSTNSMYWDGTNLVINGYTVKTVGAFGGDGSDGALAITSGTTTLSFGGNPFLVKNYSSVSITGTGALSTSNPATLGSALILRSKGNVTLTSSATPMIDCSAMGGAGGASVGPSTSYTNGNTGTNGTVVSFASNAGTGGLSSGGGQTAGSGGSATLSNSSLSTPFTVIANRYPLAICGSGGGSGAITAGGGSAATSGSGGRGGGCLIVECAGFWNFTTSNGISVAAANGGTSNDSSGTGAGGGGGGSGGFCLGLYNSLTANSGTVKVTAGTGGNNGTSGTQSAGGGGGGFLTAGSAGAVSAVSAAKTGGDGAVGLASISSNNVFA